MSLEIEIKFRVAEPVALVAQLQGLGATGGEASAQTDLYYTHPARDFGQTDEALRVRTGPAGSQITYKGPKWGGPTKTREEIEIGLAEGAETPARMGQLLERLGFRPLAIIDKHRTAFHLAVDGRDLQVVLDEAGGLGVFAEVETIAATEADAPAAQQAVLGLASRLGLTEVEPRSYLRMTLEARQAGNSSSPPATPDNSAGRA